MKSNLYRRLISLEQSIPKTEVIFFSWMQEEGAEISAAKSGSQTWVRSAEETEREFYARIKSEVTVTGPYPQIVTVS